MAVYRKKKAAEPKKKADYIVVDFPKEGEIITNSCYAFRIGASEGNTVEISIDSGNWENCRPAAGFWWYDWANYSPGLHFIKARIRDPKGKIIKESPPRSCRYQP